MSNFTRWYREGTVSATTGSSTITGTNTYWKAALLHAGDILKLGGNDYEIVNVIDDTHLTISPAFGGIDGEGKAYSIIRNFTSTMQSEIASKTSELLGDFAKYIDSDMQSIHGKSAYEVAVKNGYVGTEADWLESLKGAGEITALQELTAPLSYIHHDCLIANMFNKSSLGAITNAHWAEIRNKTYKGLHPGDYFTMDGYFYYIVGVGTPYIPTDSTEQKDGHLILFDYYAGIPSGTEAESIGSWFTDDNTDRDPRYDLSKWYVEMRPRCLERIKQHFGEQHLVQFKVTCSVFDLDTKLPTATKEVSDYLHLPSMSQLYGGNFKPFVKNGQCYSIPNFHTHYFDALLPGYRSISTHTRDIVGYGNNGWLVGHKYSGDIWSTRVATNSDYCRGIFVVKG